MAFEGLEGKVAIVTGGSRGIGKAYALSLAMAGASVVVAARSDTAREAAPAGLSKGEAHVRGLLPGTIQETVAEIEALGRDALAVRCDVSKEDDIKALVATVMERFGRIDVLVNNAGTYPRYGSLEIDPEEFDWSFRVNTLGPYLCCKHVLPIMIAQKSGSVINLTSRTSMIMPFEGWTPALELLVYAVTKAGVNRLTTYLAGEVAPHNIAINALVPGMIVTDGLRDAMDDDYDFDHDKVNWLPATPDVLGPALLYLAKQSAQTFSGRIVITDEFGDTWP